jgi:F-type H+-transporting ATPase subunit epsilon
MPDKINLEVSTPDRLVLRQAVDEVVLPSVEGYMGVLPGHAPLLARLDVGEISYRIGSERKYLACSGGFAEVLAETVSVLAETAEPAEGIDVARAEQARARAEQKLKAELSEHEFRLAEISMKKALLRLDVSARLRD